MQTLSNATAKGRSNTAGCLKLAVFFLFCLCLFSACPQDASGGEAAVLPYVIYGKLYSFSPSSLEEDRITQHDFFNVPDSFTQNATAASKKKGYILAWNQQNKKLYHITGQKLASKVDLKANQVYAGSNYILAQSSSFIDNKGFSFTLYSIKYSLNGRKIKLRSVWTGYIDCFVSNFFFTNDGVCVAGGTRDDTKNNAFYITEDDIHKCFSTAKDSDFLRLIPVEKSKGASVSKVYAFLSCREKFTREAMLYSFNLDDAPEKAQEINLGDDALLPQGFDCFFGYGFESNGKIVLPASINNEINFVCYDYAAGKITKVVSDAVGCFTALANSPDGFYYIARDPTIEDSWYGISLFDGQECKKITKFF
ncbi:MAG: hypothetical protein J5726_04740 [Treponema sp.]|nr:hypothetical protein [Treponema sp.]